MFRKSFNKRRKRPNPPPLQEMIDKAEQWDDRYLEVVIHSIDRHASDDRDVLIKEFLSKKNRGTFKATNPHSKRLWVAELIQQFLRFHGREPDRIQSWDDIPDPPVAFAFVTLTHDEWACADSHIEFNLTRAKEKVRNALGGNSFIATFEAALYKNENWTTAGVDGNLISFHCHAVVWAGNRTELDRLRSYIRPRFTPILGNKNGARFEELPTLGDAAQSIFYQAKMPFLGKRTLVDDKGKKTQKDTSKITYKSRFRLFEEMRKYSLFEFSLAGGEGSRILRETRKRLRRNHQRQRDALDPAPKRIQLGRRDSGRGTASPTRWPPKCRSAHGQRARAHYKNGRFGRRLSEHRRRRSHS